MICNRLFCLFMLDQFTTIDNPELFISAVLFLKEAIDTTPTFMNLS